MTLVVGKRAEDIAARYLASRGLIIIAKNVSYTCGELDLIARDKETLVFVEVKYRKNTDFGSPYEAVTTAKQKKIIRAAQIYLQRFEREPLCRFDVISLSGDMNAPIIEHLCDAFFVETP